jgi:hypothetical protein
MKKLFRFELLIAFNKRHQLIQSHFKKECAVKRNNTILYNYKKTKDEMIFKIPIQLLGKRLWMWQRLMVCYLP